MINIDGIGETQINSLKMFFNEKKNLDVISNLSKLLNIQNFKKKKTQENLKARPLCLPGNLTIFQEQKLNH